jgi:hypothetical protein
MPRTPARAEHNRERRLAAHSAFFALDAALAAGFEVIAASARRLAVLPPPGMAPAISGPIVAALEANKAGIINLLRWLGAEARRGILWMPGDRGRAQ